MHPLFTIFGLSISSYAVLILCGAALHTGLCLLLRKKHNFSVSDILFSLLYAYVGALAGGKFLYLIVEWRLALENISLVLFGGGFVFYGGLLGGFLLLLFYAKKTRLPLLPLTDTFLPGVCLAHAFGRIGCFLAGCCYGCETASCLGVLFPEGGIAPSGVPLLPTQLLEAGFLLLLCTLLLLLFQKAEHTGLVSAVYGMAYSAWRFLIEFFRADARGAVGALSTSQFLSLFLFAASICLLIFVYQHKKMSRGQP